MQAQFKAISISHEKAPLEVRELFHLNNDQCRVLSTQIQQVLGLEEIFVLSTCNRTEVYVMAEELDLEVLFKLLCIEKGIQNSGQYLPYFDQLSDTIATSKHLFEVSMGLRSQVIGDLQISNQVKQAYSLAAELQLAGPFLHRLLHTIFHTNKRVQQETAYRDGAASVSYAAASLARDLVANHKSPSVLVIGMGEMACDVAKQFVSGGFGRIAIMNRTDESAASFATEIGIEAIPFHDLQSAVRQFNVVVTAVATPEPLITPAIFEGAGFAPRFLIDLSVPRSVAASVEQVPGILVYDIDEIRARTDETLRLRLAAVPRVEAIIAEDMANFSDWSRELSISPTIQKLKDALEQIRVEEVAKFVKGAAAQEVELMDKVTKSMVNKIVKLPVLQLKAACKRGEQETLIDLLNDLFDLEKSVEVNSH
jgi:glutamyl-tRNA reductase